MWQVFPGLQFVWTPSPLSFWGEALKLEAQRWGKITPHDGLKGKLGDLFLSAQSFCRPQTKTGYKRQFSPKSPKVGQKSVYSPNRSDAEIANKWIPPAGRMTELMDSPSSSDDRIGGFPQ